jgi:hypothetical protein
MGVMRFTPKMQAALGHYANDPTRNKEAAYRVGYNCANMQDHVVQVKSAELFKHPLMAEALKQMKSLAMEKTAIDAAWVLERAAKVADFNVTKFITADPETGERYFDFDKATEDDWYCLTMLGQHTVGLGLKKRYALSEIVIKPGHQLKALAMVGDSTNVQAFQKNVALSGRDGGPVVTRTLNDFYGDESGET